MPREHFTITLGGDAIASFPMPDAMPLYFACVAALAAICYILATR